jgi:hypothetical protein|eukprot:COSAG01_NODE_506_length_16125_cov_5.130912_15_plen_336_part_00
MSCGAVVAWGGQAKCLVTGHEMVAELGVCRKHAESKSFCKAKRRQAVAAHDFTQYLPHIVAHRTDPHLLYCQRTSRVLMKDASAVQNHVKGRKYQLQLQKWGQSQGQAKARALTRPGRQRGEGGDHEEDDHEEDDDDDDDDDDRSDIDMEEMRAVTGHGDGDDGGQGAGGGQEADPEFELAEVERQVLAADDDDSDENPLFPGGSAAGVAAEKGSQPKRTAPGEGVISVLVKGDAAGAAADESEDVAFGAELGALLGKVPPKKRARLQGKVGRPAAAAAAMQGGSSGRRPNKKELRLARKKARLAQPGAEQEVKRKGSGERQGKKKRSRIVSVTE